jgi:hypothetical protein
MRLPLGAVVEAVLGTVLVLSAASGCARCNAPELPDAVAFAPPPPPPPPVVRDAGPDAVDAGPDGPPATHHHAVKKPAPAPSGGGGALKVEGPLAKPDADRVVSAGAARMRSCYEAALAGNPALKGRVSFQLTVDARGRVTLGEVTTSTLGDSDPEMCMIRATRDFKFQPASGESRVTFGMTFGR